MLTNQEIEQRLEKLIEDERRSTKDILERINLAYERKIYLERGYPRMFDWLTRHYGYSESAAQRRIQAAKLIKTVPEAANVFTDGKVNLTVLAKTQSAFQCKERFSGQTLTAEEKIEVLKKVENQSVQAAENTLITLFPELETKLTFERRTLLSPESTRLSLTLSNQTVDELERIKDLLSHSIPDANFATIIGILTQDYLLKKDPLLKNTTAVPSFKSPHSLSLALRRAVIFRDQGKCTYKDLESGTICGSTYQIEIDHIKPRAIGGGNELENLRCLCRNHNQLMAEKNLGAEKANQWRKLLERAPRKIPSANI